LKLDDHTVIMGIDPGFEGAVVVIDYETGGYISYRPFPVGIRQVKNTRKAPKNSKSPPKAMRNQRYYDEEMFPGVFKVGESLNVIAFVEKVGSRPGEGVSSAFNFGTGYGLILGCLAALEIPFKKIIPRAWAIRMHQGTDRSLDAKARSRMKFQMLRDQHRLWYDKPDQGMVDAYLLAEFGRINLQEGLIAFKGDSDG